MTDEQECTPTELGKFDRRGRCCEKGVWVEEEGRPDGESRFERSW